MINDITGIHYCNKKTYYDKRVSIFTNINASFTIGVNVISLKCIFKIYYELKSFMKITLQNWIRTIQINRVTYLQPIRRQQAS